MSTNVVPLACAVALVACAGIGRRSEPTGPPRITVTRLPQSAPAGSDTSSWPRPAQLPRPTEDAGAARFDVDAAAFARPRGAFAIVHLGRGDRELRELPTAFLACVSGGHVYLRLSLAWPDAGTNATADVAEREGVTAAVDCVLARARSAAPWRGLEGATHAEVFVLGTARE